MRLRTAGACALLVTSCLVLATGCAANEASEQSAASGLVPAGTYNGAGASSQEAAQAAWIAQFQSAHDGVTVNYSPVGSGAGRKQFLEGAVPFAGSDSPLNDDELRAGARGCAADSAALSVPVYISPIAVAFNVDGVDALNLDAETIARIFSGEVTTWNDPAITDLNPNQTLPDLPITVVYRADDSGTTKNFAEYLHANAAQVWTEEPSDTFPFSFPGAEGAQGTSGVVEAISGGTGTIGYADASRTAGLYSVALKVGDDFVPYSAEAAARTVESSSIQEGRVDGDLAIDLDRASSASGTYPLILVSYMIVCQQYPQAQTADFVKAYLGYVTSEEGQQAAADGAGSAPLSASTRELIGKSLDSIS